MLVRLRSVWQSGMGVPEDPPRSVVRFGDFELDLRSRELRKRGVRIALQERPLQVLEVLLRTPGELVTREALQHELWGGDTFVDFETGLNAAVRRLREALGDAAGVPRFVETLPRRGYRFIGPVHAPPQATHKPEVAAPVATAEPLPTPPPPAPAPPPRSPWNPGTRYVVAVPSGLLKSRRWKMAAAAIVAAGAAATWWWWPVTSPLPARAGVMRLDVDLGVPLSRSQAGPDVGISPNGERLVFMSNGRLFTRRLDQSTSIALEGTDGALSFFFSPDSTSLAFFADAKLKRISLDGGSVVTICDAPDGRGGTWGDDEVIIAALGKLEALSRVPAAGGVPAPLTRLAPGEITHRWPQRVPGRNALLFTSNTRPTGFDKARIDVLSLADGRRKTLVEHASFGRYIQTADGTDYLVFRRGAAMFAAALDPIELQLRGAPFPILEQVASSDAFGFASFDSSRTGTWVYRGQDLATVNWLDNSGVLQPLLAEPRGYEWLHLSHDGRRLAFVLGGEVWVHDIGRETRTRLASDASVPLWTPDDRFIVFHHPEGLSWVRSDGGTPPQALTRTNHAQLPFSFSGDGQLLSFQELNASGQEAWNLWTVPVQIDDSGVRASTPQPFLVTAFDEREITLSADRRWVAYSSDDSGRREIYVRAFPDDGRKWQVSTGGGNHPQWSRVPQELFFQAADGLIMMTPYSVHAGGFVTEKPRVWSKQPVDNRNENRYFTVASDASRVAGIVPFVPPGQRPDRSVTLLINALDQFGRHTPTSRLGLPALLARETP